MALYPNRIVIDEEQIARLTKTYKRAYLSIYKSISSSTSFGAARRKTILAQVEAVLKELGVNTSEFIAKNIPLYYKSGADDAVAQLKKIYYPVEIKTGFNRVHKEAISALVDDTAQSFGGSISGVNRSARSLMSAAVKESLTQEIATGLVSGSASKTIRKNLMLALQEQGLSALQDKGGRSWSLDNYTEMLLRTKMVEARNSGLTNRLVENGVDLVVVSTHQGSCDECASWQGQILSITGATTEIDGESIPTVADAEAGGLFHHRCRHALNALNLELARETMSWNADTGQYEKGLL